MTKGNFPSKECTKQLLLYLLTGDVKANFSRDTITLPNLIMVQCNISDKTKQRKEGDNWRNDVTCIRIYFCLFT